MKIGLTVALLVAGSVVAVLLVGRDELGMGTSAAIGVGSAFTVSQLDEYCASAGGGTVSGPGTFASDAVRVEPGESIQEAADSAGRGATIVLGTGRHVGQSVAPRTGQAFIGEPGAVMEGQGAAFAFASGAAEVTIAGLVIEDYSPAPRGAAIEATEGASDWLVEGNVIRNNGEVGVRVRQGSTVRGNVVYGNGRYGVTGSGLDVVVEDNEIYCNADVHGATGDSSATKFIFTRDLVLRNNEVHHNYGNGLWVDVNNLDALIEGNRIRYNELSGIVIEISCGGVIERNELVENGFGTKRPDRIENAGIVVANSPNVTIRGNRLTGNAKGIGAIHWHHPARDQVDRCIPHVSNLVVDGNHITQDAGLFAGLEATIENAQVFGTWANQFRDNRYSGNGLFSWDGDIVDRDGWSAAGQS